MTEAIAGAVARRKPAEVNSIDQAEIVNIRRKRAWRSEGDGEAILRRQLANSDPGVGRSTQVRSVQSCSWWKPHTLIPRKLSGRQLVDLPASVPTQCGHVSVILRRRADPSPFHSVLTERHPARSAGPPVDRGCHTHKEALTLHAKMRPRPKLPARSLQLPPSSDDTL